MPPTGPSRQQRRQQERRLADLGRSALARGFPPSLDDEVSLGVSMVLRGKLKEVGNHARASEAATLAEQLLDRSNAGSAADAQVACRRGCSHCCIAAVSITAPEIFRIAGWLRHTKGLLAALTPALVIERAKTSCGIPVEEMMQRGLPCPLLIDGACGIYTARPLSCRQLLSRSEASCRTIYSGGKIAPPFIDGALQRGVLARIVPLGAVKSVGLSDTSYELSGALLTALADVTTERRWLAGEDVFAGVQVTERPASTQEFIDRMARLLNG
jgi:hypothetical protein